MASFKIAAAAALAAATFAGAAQAQDAGRWFVHAGPAFVEPAESADMTAGGQPVPGADVSIDGRWTAEVEVGYFLTPNIALAAAGGFPPKFNVDASGTLAALGRAGTMTGGPAGVMAQYHFNPDGPVSPYVGAGASFLIVFDTEDGALNDLEADSAVGTVVQAGVNVMANDRWGAFFDVKKAWVGTVAKANLGPTPVRAKVKVDPLVVNAGLTYRF
ncbi:OmpW/AlkL family protein [Phenylobacterium sp.]|uniref:OmpW/AlkL family protein n=1 Tax=Phenylobacterium sp. TaxID=1871053 RepID=UPI002F946A8B